jgi:type IV fimbrial biogenesis protein FimT
MEITMKQRGFTVIEVVIVVAVIGFLLAAAAPSASAWIRNSRIRTAAESIAVGLQQARNEAVRRNQPVSFFLVSDTDPTAMSNSCALSATSSGWVVALASPAAKCATDRDAFIALRPPGNTASGLSVAAEDSSAAAATTVTFNGYGQVSNAVPISCIRITSPIDASARALNIAVNSGGQVRMCDPKVTDASDPRKCVAGCA